MVRIDKRTYADKKKYLTYDKVRFTLRRYRMKVKLNTLTHYGGGICACVKCGFSDIRALSIDHIDGNGAQHRREINQMSGDFYGWLKRNSYPDGYQTLCMNCQFIKRFTDKEQCL